MKITDRNEIYLSHRKKNGCQQNYSEHILKMPTNQILRKLFDYQPARRKKRG
jgi:hypothetical protein